VDFRATRVPLSRSAAPATTLCVAFDQFPRPRYLFTFVQNGIVVLGCNPLNLGGLAGVIKVASVVAGLLDD